MRSIIKAFAASLAISIILLSRGAAQATVSPAAPAPTASATVAEGGLTLAELRIKVLENSAALKKAGIAVDNALLVQKGQGYGFLPTVTGSAKASLGYGTSTTGTGSAALAVNQSIWDGGKNAVLMAIDALATSEARAAARSAYFSALETADDAYYAVLADDDAVQAAQGDLDAATASLSLAQAKLEAGVIIKADLLKAQADEAAAETTLSLARRALQAATMKLASITGLGLPLKVAGVDFASYDGLMSRLAGMDDSSLEAFVGRISASAASNNPSIAEAQYASDKARLAVDEAASGYFPSLAASWTNGLSYAQGGLGYSGSLSITASIPLDFWNSAVSVQEGKLASTSSLSDLAEAKRSLDLDIRTAVYAWVSTSRSIYSSRKAYDYAQSNYESVLESYRLSLVSASDLSDAASLVSTDRKAWNAARYDFLQNLSALKYLAGIEGDDPLLGMVP